MAANCGNLPSLLVRVTGTLSADRPGARLPTRLSLKREQDAAPGLRQDAKPACRMNPA